MYRGVELAEHLGRAPRLATFIEQRTHHLQQVQQVRQHGFVGTYVC